MRFQAIWAFARAEMRLTRRLVRYWVFVILTALLALLNFAQFHFLHYFISGYSASAATTNPRFWFGNFGTNFVLLFLIGLVFLGFDVRARDRRERMVEVLDALPCSNLELIFGRALGLVIVSWVPLLVITGLVELVGVLLRNSIEPTSIVTVLFLMSLPGFLFTVALVFLLTLLLRHRLLASVAALIVLAASFFVSLWWLPLWSTSFVDVTGGFNAPLPSDVAPQLMSLSGMAQRAGYLAAGIGLLLLAAAVHPRRDDASRAVRATAGLLVFALGAVLVGSVVWGNVSVLRQKRHWLEAHDARSGDPAPDLSEISGQVVIEPGRRLGLELVLRFRAPASAALETALFTLNPGLAVESARTPGGRALEFEQGDGLLEVRLPERLAPGEELSIALTAAGVPLGQFAYIDAAMEPLELTAANAQVIVLGWESLLFRSGHVSMMPGARWLPSSGTASRGRLPDFHRVDLTVDLPAGWLVAGPGRRLDPAEPAASGRVRYRFAPAGFLPGVALVAGRYESRATEVDGIVLEALLHPGHTRTIDFFEDAADEVRAWIGERLQEARESGLDYPYDALTLVEVPTSLRGYGGGWRMDTTLSQPGLILVREAGFPTARFDSPPLEREFEGARDREGGIPRAKREALVRFFENDMNGGNPFIAAARDFFGFQTRGRGPAAVPLDFVWENLTSKVLADRAGYFSVHFFDNKFGQTFAEAAQRMQNDADRVGNTYAEIFTHMLTSTPEVWEAALGASLAQLDPWDDPKRAINVLSLKGGAMARSLLDSLGREDAARFLAALRRRAAGETYDREDVIAAGDETGADLAAWLELWIDETDLPGFTLGDVAYDRLTDAADGTPRYQLVVTVRNEEQPPGLVRLEYLTEDQQATSMRARGEPVRIPGRSAVQIGLVGSSPLRSVRVAPYFALNRDPFSVPLPRLDAERMVAAEPFDGVREIPWTEPDRGIVVVDDLDDGFALDESAERGLWRFGGSGADAVLDQGLPVTQSRRPARWSRLSASYAYGRYRRTMAVVRAGDGERRAIFTAELPRSGSWQLEYYLPEQSTRARRPGTWDLTVEHGSAVDAVDFDAGGGEAGWNPLGSFDVAAGEVRVSVSDDTDGDYVIADAIRWVPVASVASSVARR